MRFSRGVSRLFADIVTSSFDQECLPKLSGGDAVVKFESSRKWQEERESVMMILYETRRVAVDEGICFFPVARKVALTN